MGKLNIFSVSKIIFLYDIFRFIFDLDFYWFQNPPDFYPADFHPADQNPADKNPADFSKIQDKNIYGIW